jgi:hypothetical protein
MLGEVFGDLRSLAIKGGLLHGCEPYIRQLAVGGAMRATPSCPYH